MAQWVGICGQRLQPLADALRQHLLTQAVVHVDETPVSLLVPGRGKTKKAYVWVYRSSDFSASRAVYYDFTPGRGGDNPPRVLQGYTGTLVHDDYAGYNAVHADGQITSALCMAHARRKLWEVHKLNGSEIAAQAVAMMAQLYEVEAQLRAPAISAQERLRVRQEKSAPLAQALHDWLTQQRPRLAKADATARAMDYTLSNWEGLTQFLRDGEVPIDNNPAENALRPLVVGRKNWLFVGSVQAGERAAVIMSLIESAKLCGHDPWAYLKDVFERLPTLKNSALQTLLPHNWQPPEGQPALAVPANVALDPVA